MFGFAVGTLCLVGLVGLVGSRHGGACGRHGYGGWESRWERGGRRGSWGGPAFRGMDFHRVAAEVLKRRLRIDEDQEGIVDHAMKDLREAVVELRDVVRDSRADIGEAFRGETVDDAALAAIFANHDEALGRTRRSVVSALKQIHAVLSADQRKTAADWLGSAEPRWV